MGSVKKNIKFLFPVVHFVEASLADLKTVQLFTLARLPTETARELFLDHFLKETALPFFFLLLKPVQCLGKTFSCLVFCPVT